MKKKKEASVIDPELEKLDKEFSEMCAWWEDYLKRKKAAEEQKKSKVVKK